MVKGDEKLLFISDLDGESDTHLKWLVESAGSVLDAIFKHVDDAPATRVADNPQRVITWLKYHVREPLDAYRAYEASVQEIKTLARAAGFTGNTSQAPLLTYMSFKSRVQGFVLKLLGPALIGEKGHHALSDVGTVHFSHCVPFENNHLGFFTSLRRLFREVHPGLRRQNLVHFQYALSTYRWRAANPSSKERPGVLSVGIGKQLSAHRVLQRLSRPLGSGHSSTAGRPQVTIGHHSIGVVERRSIRSSALAKPNRTQGETRNEPEPSDD